MMTGPHFKLARRAATMKPSAIREILKLTEQPGVISFSGGLPSPATFPAEAVREACDRVLRDHPREALQYAASEGFAPLREWVAADLAKQGMRVGAAQVLLTTGSQQGLDLLAKVLIDEGSTVLVEAPTYLGALQAFAVMEPRFAGVAGDDDGPSVDAMTEAANADGADARFFYLLPNFQNPTGRMIAEARRVALCERAAAIGLPLVEDNPYGDLWFDEPPPPSLAGRHPEGTVYLGSFSKVLAPGLRLGYVVAPPALLAKLVQAKQAADLHSSGFNQRVVYEVIQGGFLDRHVPGIRALYKSQRDAMLAALERHTPPGVLWNRPAGGMFLWLRLPADLNAVELLPLAVARGVAFVPGAPFFADTAPKETPGRPKFPCVPLGGQTPQGGGFGGCPSSTLRLSFVTANAEQIETGIGALGDAIRAASEHAR